MKVASTFIFPRVAEQIVDYAVHDALVGMGRQKLNDATKNRVG